MSCPNCKCEHCKPRAIPFDLSEREIQVLELLAFSNKEIGQHLNLSPNTVEMHLWRIRAKTGLSSRVSLALLWDKYKRGEVCHDSSNVLNAAKK